MDTKIKNYLGTAVIVVLAVFAYASLSYVNSYSKSIEPSSFRSFTVSGEGKVVAVPDVAQFTFGVLTEGGTDVAKIQRDNVERANKVIEFLKSKGVDAKDIKTESFSIDPRYENYNCVYPRYETGEAPIACPPPKIVGYTVSQSVSVKIRNFDTTGDILGGAAEHGANSVSQLSFTIDEPAKVESEARAKAIAQAKEKAEAIADAGGFRVGRLLSLQEGGNFPMYYGKALGMGGDMGMGSVPAPAPSIQPGSQDVVSNVSLVYEIR